MDDQDTHLAYDARDTDRVEPIEFSPLQFHPTPYMLHLEGSDLSEAQQRE